MRSARLAATCVTLALWAGAAWVAFRGGEGGAGCAQPEASAFASLVHLVIATANQTRAQPAPGSLPALCASAVSGDAPARPSVLGRVAVMTMNVHGLDPRGPNKRTRVVTYSDKTADTSDVTLANFALYANYHGYDLHTVSDSLDPTRPLAWSKFPGMLALFDQGYDWVIYLDIDAIFTNLTRPLEDVVSAARSAKGCNENSGFFVSTKNWTTNSGVMVAQNTPVVRALLRSMSSRYRKSWNGLQDNRAVIEELDKGIARPGACVLRGASARLLQSVVWTTDLDQFGNYAQGDWIVHLAGPCAPWCRITMQLAHLCALYPCLPECAPALTRDNWRPMSSYGKILDLPPVDASNLP
jgi:hypothetical protein